MLLGKIYTENTPRLKQEVFLKKVDVPNTDPLGLFKRVPIPLTQNGSKKGLPSLVVKRVQVLIGECLSKKDP